MLAQYKISGYRSLDASTRKRKTERVYYIKQKLSGFVMLASGITASFILDGDVTFSILTIPLGAYLLVTRQKVMAFR